MLFRSRMEQQNLTCGRDRDGHRSQRLPAVIGIALCFFGAHAAYGADATLDVTPESVPVERSNWALQVTPYIWAAGLDGHISPFRRGPTIGIEKSFSDVVDDLNFGGFINVWGRYDDIIFSGDIMYVDTTGGHGAGPLPAFSLPNGVFVPQGTTINAAVDTKQFTATLQGGYRVLDAPRFTLDALAGARIWYISNDVTLTAALGGGSVTYNYGESFGWVDPLVGLRAFLTLTEKLSFQGQADIGGFGAGSDYTWSVLATFNYAFSDHLSASAGYKVLDVDYVHKGHVYDVRLSGPVLGITYRF